MKRIDTCTKTDLLVGLLLAGIVSVLLAYRIFAYLCEVTAFQWWMILLGLLCAAFGHRRLPGSPPGLEAPAISAGPPLRSLSKIPLEFSDKRLQSAARIICSPQANKFHTCSLRGIFPPRTCRGEK